MEAGFEYYAGIELKTLVLLTFLVAVMGIGIVEFLKNFTGRGFKGWRYAVLSFCVVLLCSYMQTPMVSPRVTQLFNIMFCSLVVTQTSYQLIVKAIPRAVSTFIDKVLKTNMGLPGEAGGGGSSV